MAALVQGYPRQSGTATMLQTRPASSTGIIQPAQSQSSSQYGHNMSQRNNSIHGMSGVVGAPVVYRPASGSVQQYAFTNAPALNHGTHHHQFRQHRTSSTPSVPQVQNFDQSGARPRYQSSNSMTTLPSAATISGQSAGGSRDDSVISVGSSRRVAPLPRPHSAHLGEIFSVPLIASAGPAKVSPERYRRPAQRANESAPTMSNTSEQKSGMLRGPNGSLPHRPNSFVGSLGGSAVDDMLLPHGQVREDVKRARRSSMPALDSAGLAMPLTPLYAAQPADMSSKSRKTGEKEIKTSGRTVNNLSVDRVAAHTRTSSTDSRSSSRSTASSGTRPASSANRSANVANPTGNPAHSSIPEQHHSNGQDHARLVNIPPRGSSSDATNTKRLANPSPLSKPVAMDTEAGRNATAGAAAGRSASPVKTAPSPRVDSPAAKQLAAVSQNDSKPKSKTSRLRRAFSFGSAAEFRKAAYHQDAENGPSKLHKDRNPDELFDAEQARIAQQQEAAGIGSNIYGPRIFGGSTDNLSISSTASSASVMIRKMGRGMKKSTRSLAGLFRPKSVTGVPAADAKAPDASHAAVSMITVEAERERVNVNADVRSQSGGGTGFPRLERNSLDASRAPGLGTERAGSLGSDGSAARKSIIGGERERAEVLAAVRKGILKHTNSNSPSPSPRPAENRGLDAPSAITDSPNSSAPSTPNNDDRAGQVPIGNEDYFVTALRLRQDTKSAPGTPQGSMKRNATFSPRIAFYETWPSQEYDRRGEVATCNRLTPVLAQQIKEELNSFKMEMEVHENSKIYTHFF
ncbi:bud neck involved protein [Neurospora sp. IMI 360204]|nr:bud neck involved protein [Neurospora sp. IMI 360204]